MLKSIISFILSIVRIFFEEIAMFVYYLGMGVFKFFDFIFTTLFSIFSSIFYGIWFIFKNVFTVIKFILWDSFILEIFELFKNFFLGIYYIIKFVLYDIPKFIIDSAIKLFKAILKRFKSTFTIIGQFFEELPNKIKDYFVNKFNNLQIVKYYRNKRDRELEVLYIDKNGIDAKRSEEKHAYEYLARNKDGKLVRGYFMALSRLDTHSYLLDEGYEVYEIKTNKWIDFLHGESIFHKARMRNKDLIFWLAQLSTYIKSGVTLTESVKILAVQNKNRRYKRAFDSMIYELTMGESFSEALRKQGNLFPPLLINMIKAAEKMGDIESTLDEMSDYYDEIEKNRKAIIGALTYPTIILVFAIGIIFFILSYIIPQFVDVYKGLGIKLNPYTQMIINISSFLSTNWRYLLLGFIAVVLILYLVYKNVKGFRTAVQYVLMHIPVIGKIIIYNEMTIFSKTFASLNKNNVLLTESIDILSKITNNEIYKLIMFDTISNLLRGDKMSESFKNNWAIPDLAYHMIATGESTGELSTMLDKVADYYQLQQKSLTDQLKTFIEPIMIIFLAVIVGGIVLSIIIPLFEVYKSIS